MVNVVISNATRVPLFNFVLSSCLRHPTTYLGPLVAFTIKLSSVNCFKTSPTICPTLWRAFKSFSDLSYCFVNSLSCSRTANKDDSLYFIEKVQKFPSETYFLSISPQCRDVLRPSCDTRSLLALSPRRYRPRPQYQAPHLPLLSPLLTIFLPKFAKLRNILRKKLKTKVDQISAESLKMIFLHFTAVSKSPILTIYFTSQDF